MAIIYIDHKPYEVKPGKNLLESCLTLGFNVPYFCWHAALGSVGACRQCAVKVFKDAEDTTGRLVMSCMEPVKDNMYVSIEDPTAKAFRAQVIEWLMTNHPHDCAVCDEGGSCHLQDMTVMTGHTYRRFAYKKRSYKNQYLGPFINHEMNRCIQCYRCVRYYKDYAGGKDLDVFAAHNHVYFGRAQDGVLESEFSGNLVEVCPTGVFTDKTLKEHYTRKWDMTMAPSVCHLCSLGCNIIGGERYGELRQITNRYNSDVNGYFICDRGRFGYEFVNSMNRIQQPLIRANIPDAANKQSLFKHLTGVLVNNKLIGIGSARASLESNFALRQLVGPENFYQGISDVEAGMMHCILDTLSSGRVHTPSLKETEHADAVLILGEDLTNSAPMLALALRQAVKEKPFEAAQQISVPSWHDAALREYAQQSRSPLIIAYPTETKLDDISSGTLHISPDEIARLAYAIAHVLNNAAPEVPDLDEDTLIMARHIAGVLKTAERPLIIAGTSLFNEGILKAATNIAYALEDAEKKANLCFVVRECNSVGLALMDAPSFQQMPMEENNPAAVVILESDLYRNAVKKDVDALLNHFTEVVVLDHLHNETTNRATALIPVATFAEADGTLVNNEGRAQRFFQVFMPKNEDRRESWRWLDEFRQFKEGIAPEELEETADLTAQMVQLMPQFEGAEAAAPDASFRIAGQKIPREPHRYSGRTAMLANINVSEPKPPEDRDTPLSYTMEGYKGMPPAALIPFFWAPGWNSVQSVNKYQKEVGAALKSGEIGKRILPESGIPVQEFSNHIPVRSAGLPGEWQIIPLQHIFGSEELSMYTPGLADRAAKPYAAINVQGAELLGVKENENLNLHIGEMAFTLPVVIKKEMPNGLAGVPFNVAELKRIAWPAVGKLTKA
jgi:NADH-quinone oxidoreductase subunit G